MAQLDSAYQQVHQFKQGSLRTRLAELEKDLQGNDPGGCITLLDTHTIDPSLLVAALILKHASSQINEVVHALGILLSLPHLLGAAEVVEYVSLGAGNTGRPFDLETNQRIAEFKFIDWKGGPEAVRQNQLFKDFYLLAEYPTSKARYLYVIGTASPLKFLNGGRSLSSVMSRGNKLWTEFQTTYGSRFARVSEYYAHRKEQVNIIDLATVVPAFAQSIQMMTDEGE